MRKRTHTQPASTTEYFGDDGAQIGALSAIRHGGRTVHVGFAHDWDGDSEGYDPLVIGVFDDPETGVAEIELRARQAQAPATLPGW